MTIKKLRKLNKTTASKQGCLLFVKPVKKLTTTDQFLFLSVIRQVQSPKQMKYESAYAMRAVRAQLMTEGNERVKMKLEGPKEDFK